MADAMLHGAELEGNVDDGLVAGPFLHVLDGVETLPLAPVKLRDVCLEPTLAEILEEGILHESGVIDQGPVELAQLDETELERLGAAGLEGLSEAIDLGRDVLQRRVLQWRNHRGRGVVSHCHCGG